MTGSLRWNRAALAATIAAAHALVGIAPASAQRGVVFPVGVRHALPADPAERQRELEELRRLRFTIVENMAPAPAGGVFLVDRLLSGAPDARFDAEHLGVVAVRPGRSAAEVVSDGWRSIANGARGLVFDDWKGLVSNPDALTAAADLAGHLTRNAPLYAPLRPRVTTSPRPDVVLTPEDPALAARFLESPDAIVFVLTNASAQPREVTMAFSAEMPEAIWQNMITGATVHFVAAPEGPVYTRQVDAHGVLVLMIRKQWR